MMLLIKLLLVLLLCIPVMYIAFRFIRGLREELDAQQEYSERIPRKRPNRRQDYPYDFRYMGAVDRKRRPLSPGLDRATRHGKNRRSSRPGGKGAAGG